MFFYTIETFVLSLLLDRLCTKHSAIAAFQRADSPPPLLEDEFDGQLPVPTSASTNGTDESSVPMPQSPHDLLLQHNKTEAYPVQPKGQGFWLLQADCVDRNWREFDDKYKQLLAREEIPDSRGYRFIFEMYAALRRNDKIMEYLTYMLDQQIKITNSILHELLTWYRHQRDLCGAQKLLQVAQQKYGVIPDQWTYHQMQQILGLRQFQGDEYDVLRRDYRTLRHLAPDR